MRSLISPVFVVFVVSLLAAPLHARVAVDLEAIDFTRSRIVELPATSIPHAVQSLAVVDVDRDGVDDLVAFSKVGEQAEVVLRFGNPAAVYPHYPQSQSIRAEVPFAAAAGPFEAPARSTGLMILDVNLDGAADLVVLDSADQPVAWLESGLASQELPPLALQPIPPDWLTALPSPLHGQQALRFEAGLERSRKVAHSIRLSAHGGGDVVTITEAGKIRFIPRALGASIVVNSSLNLGDSYDLDGFCDTANDPTAKPPVPPSGVCTLRAAIEQANFNAGADTIQFAIGGGGAVTIGVSGSVLEITGPLTLDGSTQGGFAGLPLINLDFLGGGILPGLSVMAGPTLIRGFVIGGFTAEGIGIFADDVTVETCYLGTDAGGTAANPNFRGLGISGDRGQIGGAFAGTGNLISGNLFGGVVLAGSEQIFQGNHVGTDFSGSFALGNGAGGTGVLVTGSASRISASLVSGHSNTGIRIEGNNNVVVGNKVGTNAAGDAALANFFAGIYLNGVEGGLVGSFLNPVGSNLVSGNFGDGIRVAASSMVTIAGNIVGTDLAGEAPLGNDFNGIHLEASGGTPSSAITVGGPFTIFGAMGNQVSANGAEGWHGIFVEGGSFGNDVRGNLIGLNRTGTGPLGNMVDGVRIQEAGFNSIGVIGAAPIDFPNVIAYNGGAGIAVVDVDAGAGGQNSNGNQILVNNIFDNGGLGIDLTLGTAVLDGPTANDGGDTDFGPNRLQNFPEITLVTADVESVTQTACKSF